MNIHKNNIIFNIVQNIPNGLYNNYKMYTIHIVVFSKRHIFVDMNRNRCDHFGHLRILTDLEIWACLLIRYSKLNCWPYARTNLKQMY